MRLTVLVPEFQIAKKIIYVTQYPARAGFLELSASQRRLPDIFAC